MISVQLLKLIAIKIGIKILFLYLGVVSHSTFHLLKNVSQIKRRCTKCCKFELNEDNLNVFYYQTSLKPLQAWNLRTSRSFLYYLIKHRD